MQLLNCYGKIETLTANEIEVYHALTQLLSDGISNFYVTCIEYGTGMNMRVLRGVVASMIKKHLIDVDKDSDGLVSVLWEEIKPEPEPTEPTKKDNSDMKKIQPMPEVTEIEFMALNGNINMWWGDEDKIFGELKIALSELTEWCDEHAPMFEQVPEQYTGSDWEYVPGCDEVQLYASDVFDSKEYGKQYDLVRLYLQGHALIA